MKDNHIDCGASYASIPSILDNKKDAGISRVLKVQKGFRLRLFLGNRILSPLRRGQCDIPIIITEKVLIHHARILSCPFRSVNFEF